MLREVGKGMEVLNQGRRGKGWGFKEWEGIEWSNGVFRPVKIFSCILRLSVLEWLVL